HQFKTIKFSEEECRDRDITYAAPLFVEATFVNKATGEIKEQEVFMGDFPIMTERGTFIINGTERGVVSQLVRSPGVYFSRELDKTTDKDVFIAKIIPSRGAWLEFEVDKKDMDGVRIDRKRRQNVTDFIKALGEDENPEKKTWDQVRYRVFSAMQKDEHGEGAPKYKAVLTYEDILKTVRYLVKLHAGEEGFDPDDIDHFGNRRLRSVGELIQNQIRIGLSRMERVVKERMTTQDVEAITPQTLINIRPVVASIKEFFGTSQLSQFMDQTNPLAGLTHKRRLSALG